MFRWLCDAAVSADDAGVRSLFTDPSSFDDWAVRWRHRLAEDGGKADERRAAMHAANPVFIPRNHLVEEAISAPFRLWMSAFVYGRLTKLLISGDSVHGRLCTVILDCHNRVGSYGQPCGQIGSAENFPWRK
jgi:hypothetical protein